MMTMEYTQSRTVGEVEVYESFKGCSCDYK